MQARTRHREVTDEGDCGDGSGCGNGRGEAWWSGPEPQAAINDVVVQIHCVGIHRDEADVALDLGPIAPAVHLDAFNPRTRTGRSGHRFLGYGTTGLSIGQRVFGLTDWYHRDGTPWRSMWPSRHATLTPLPGDVDFTVGAALVMPGLTAWQGLFEHGRLHAGQRGVLVHGAAAHVVGFDGEYQLAREAGAYVIGTGRAGGRQTALDFGAQEFVDLDNDALEDVDEVDLVFDVIGGDIGKRSGGPDSRRRNAADRHRPDRGAALWRPDYRLRRRTRSRPIE